MLPQSSTAIARVSPSRLSQLACPARVAFSQEAGGPHHPNDSAAVGTIVHRALELVVNGDDISEAWITAVDSYGPGGDRLPRLRRARLRYERRAQRLQATLEASPNAQPITEGLLLSEDGLLEGTPDLVLLFPDHLEVVDYKTGLVTDSDGAKEGYVRQLHIYGGLAADTYGRPATSATLLSMQEEQITFDLAQLEIEQQLESARAALAAYNERVPGSQPAAPAPGVCEWCDFKPRCDAFWDAAIATWVSSVGLCVQGTVSSDPEVSKNGLAAVTVAAADTVGELAETVLVSLIPSGLVDGLTTNDSISLTGLAEVAGASHVLRWGPRSRLAIYSGVR